MANKIEVAVLGLIVIILFGTVIISGAFSDKKGPVITFENTEDLVYTEGQDKSVLLQGVKAVDSRDGDVSDTIRIDSLITEEDVIKVKYAAKDKNNNVTVSDEYRQIKYISGESEIKAQEDNKTDNGTDTGDDNNENNSQDEPDINPTDTTDPTGEIDKKKADETGIPVITLTQKEVTIKEGQGFSNNEALLYVKETYDNSGDVSKRIRIIGNDVEFKAGDYEISYVVSDKEGNVSEPAILILHVEPAV